MRIELNEQEANAILECVDAALGVHKLRALGAARMIVDKINAAKAAELNEKTHNIAPLPAGLVREG